jgi:phosphatidylserine/phosphatidylglycerophosphate/cardiolipin synthase-like enzyme
MSDWSDSRKLIIEKLDELLMKGATIEIITKSGKGPEINNGLKSLEKKGAYVKMFNMGNVDVPKINLHSKVMMIEVVINGEKSNLVMTGTQNFTNNAIWNNNEISLFIYNHVFYEKYENYFQELKNLPGIKIPD